MQHFWQKDPQNGEIYVQTTQEVKGAFHWMIMTQVFTLTSNENILKMKNGKYVVVKGLFLLLLL